MRTTLATILGLGLGVNGLGMLYAPEAWYRNVPGVMETGPANLHFIRDIGCAYLVAGLSLLWLARSPRRAWPAAFAGGVFLALHALVHVQDTLAGREHMHRLASELPTVFLPALLALWLAWPPLRRAEED